MVKGRPCRSFWRAHWHDVLVSLISLVALVFSVFGGAEHFFDRWWPRSLQIDKIRQVNGDRVSTFGIELAISNSSPRTRRIIEQYLRVKSIKSVKEVEEPSGTSQGVPLSELPGAVGFHLPILKALEGLFSQPELQHMQALIGERLASQEVSCATLIDKGEIQIEGHVFKISPDDAQAFNLILNIKPDTPSNGISFREYKASMIALLRDNRGKVAQKDVEVNFIARCGPVAGE